MQMKMKGNVGLGFVPPLDLPKGFSFWPDFISADEEAKLMRACAGLEFSNIEMHGVTARRRAVHFGLRYSYASKQLSKGPEIPDFLLPARARFAERLGIMPEDFPQALVNEYSSGAAIGWHIDGPVYDVIAGFSIAGDCTFRLRPMEESDRPSVGDGNKKARRRIVSFLQPARSAYVMTGDVRWHWQHSIPPTKELRYSVTFRTLKS
jgi:alkylated DNA repair protein (DNA oxidative demethylase)